VSVTRVRMTLAAMRRCNAYTSHVTLSLLQQQSLCAQLVRRLSRRQLQALTEALGADRRPDRPQRRWPLPPPLPGSRTGPASRLPHRPAPGTRGGCSRAKCKATIVTSIRSRPTMLPLWVRVIAHRPGLLKVRGSCILHLPTDSPLTARCSADIRFTSLPLAGVEPATPERGISLTHRGQQAGRQIVIACSGHLRVRVRTVALPMTCRKECAHVLPRATADQ